MGTTALSVAMGRVLGADDLGLQSLISYVQALLSALLVGGLSDAAIRTLSAVRGSGDLTELAHHYRWTVTGQLVSGTASALVLVGVGLTQGDPAPWLVVAAIALLDALGWAVASRAIAADGWAPVARRRLFTQLAGQVLGVVAVLRGYGITGVFVASALASAALLVSLALLVPLPRPGRMRPFPRALFRLAVVFVGFEALNQVVSKRIEFLFLAALSTTEQVAMYSVPFMLVSVAVSLPTSIIAGGMPTVAAAAGAGRTEEATRHLGAAVRVTTAVAVPLVAGLAGLGAIVVEVLYGDGFDQAGRLVPLLALSALLVPASTTCTMYWIGVNRLLPFVVPGVVGGLVDLVAAVALIPGLGATGAAVANVLGQGTSAVLILVQTRRLLPDLRLRQRRYLPALLVSAVLALVVHVVATWVGGWAGLAVGAVLLVGGLAGWGWWRGFVDAADGAWLYESMPPALHRAARLFTGPRASQP